MSLLDTTTTKKDEIHSISFNQTSSCLCIGINKGFKVFNTQPFRENIERNVDTEISIIEMYNRSNLFAFVATENSKYGSNKVIFWDDYQIKVLLEIRFNEKILGIKLKKDIVYVVLESQIQVFNYSTMTNIISLPSYKNDLGCFALSSDPDIDIISYPESSEGYIMIKNITHKQSFLIPAHNKKIGFISISYKGEFIATSSIKGNKIRIFDSQNGQILQELRRGSEVALIYDIVFSYDCKFIACSSNRPTIHIFSLRTSYLKKNELYFRDEYNKGESLYNKDILPRNQEHINEKLIIIENELNYYKTLPKNQRSLFYNLSSLLPLPKYFSQEWSFAQLRIKDYNFKHKISFSLDNNLFIFSENGRFVNARFNTEKGGECEVLFENNIFFKV